MLYSVRCEGRDWDRELFKKVFAVVIVQASQRIIFPYASF